MTNVNRGLTAKKPGSAPFPKTRSRVWKYFTFYVFQKHLQDKWHIAYVMQNRDILTLFAISGTPLSGRFVSAYGDQSLRLVQVLCRVTTPSCTAKRHYRQVRPGISDGQNSTSKPDKRTSSTLRILLPFVRR